MFLEGRTASLTAKERAIVKTLINGGWTNQRAQALVNLGRPNTVNSGRFSAVRNDANQSAASEEEVNRYKIFKAAYDNSTGLNKYVHERLVKSRAAMRLAIQVVNTPGLDFKAETFCTVAVIAWTYLVHEYSERNGFPTHRTNGDTISLSDFLNGPDCDFTDGIRNNLRSVVKLRDASVHKLLGWEDPAWLMIFQACCVNYERWLCSAFDPKYSLAKEMSFTVQFSGLELSVAEAMAKSNLSSSVSELNADIYEGLSVEQRNNPEFQFSVVYTTVSAAASKAAFRFIGSESPEGKEISNVLVKHKPSAETHPFRPAHVVAAVTERTGLSFSQHNHAEAWRRHNVRPPGQSNDPDKTNRSYCYYNPTFRTYTYNQAWIDCLCNELRPPAV